MRFEPQTIGVRDTDGRLHSIDAQVALTDDGTRVGLAVHPVYRLGPGPIAPHTGDEYTLTHLPSGMRVLSDGPVNGEALACRWLEMIAPLADWTQPVEVVRADDTLRLRVRVAHMRAYWDEDVDRDLFAYETVPHPPSPTFTLESLAALLDWISDAAESEEVKPPMQPALDTLLVLHAGMVHSTREVCP